MASHAYACQSYNSSYNRIPYQIDIVWKEIRTDQYCTLAGKHQSVTLYNQCLNQINKIIEFVNVYQFFTCCNSKQHYLHKGKQQKYTVQLHQGIALTAWPCYLQKRPILQHKTSPYKTQKDSETMLGKELFTKFKNKS